MTTAEDEIKQTFVVAEQVADVLRTEGIEPLLIGALAMAVHNYPRQTEDLDLAVAVAPKRLEGLADSLRRMGWSVELSPSDAEDPLGGVLTVRAPQAMAVQVINFDNAPAGGFPALVRDASQAAVRISPELRFRVVSVPDLILFKLYAGGPKSEQDILELIVRNPVDLADLRRRCREYRLTAQLDKLLARVGR